MAYANVVVRVAFSGREPSPRRPAPEGFVRITGSSGEVVCRIDTPPRVCIIHTMKSADLIRELNEAGWFLDRVRGSHHVFRHPSRPGIIVVPHPKKDLGVGLVAQIRKQAGL